MNDWLARAAVKHPDRVAVELHGIALTYDAFLDQVTRSAESFAGAAYAGIDGEDPLMFAISLHACLLQGVPAVPLDPRLTVAERDARMRDRGATENVATVMFTSGTTAAPKPVGLTADNWLANALGSAVALGLDPGERWLAPMTLAHVGGLSILIRSTIYATTVVLHERFEVGAVLEDLMNPERRITLVSLVPTMLSRLLDAGLESPPTLRWALLGGGPIAPALLQRAADARVPVAPTYGMTEACSQIATFGLPLHGVELQLSDDGEVWVRGPVVAPGAADPADGWLHTGDLGAFGEDGRLSIIGRKSDTIVSGGENVAPTEVEAVLLEHPAVADAGVFARADAEWGEAVVARVVL
ncbi:MAG: AMP-binding protein, partial [Solirubrobacteraceae bacterium]